MSWAKPKLNFGATENARLELSAPNCRGGKCGTKQLWKAKTPTCYGSHNMIYLIICQNLQCSVCQNFRCSVCFYISCVYVCLFFISVLLYYTSKVSFNTMTVLVTVLVLLLMKCALTWFALIFNVTVFSKWSKTHISCVTYRGLIQ